MQQTAMENQTFKPLAVRRAIILLWASWAIGIPKTLLDWAQLTSRTSGVFNAFVIISTLAIVAFFIWKIGQGKNWARIVFLVMSLLGVVPFLFVVRSEFARSPASGLLSTVQCGIQAIAFLLLFTSPGKEWFRARHG